MSAEDRIRLREVVDARSADYRVAVLPAEQALWLLDRVEELMRLRTADVVHIARCPEHGLHGERTECFTCGGPVEQVAMIPAGRRARS